MLLMGAATLPAWLFMLMQLYSGTLENSQIEHINFLVITPIAVLVKVMGGIIGLATLLVVTSNLINPKNKLQNIKLIRIGVIIGVIALSEQFITPLFLRSNYTFDLDINFYQFIYLLFMFILPLISTIHISIIANIFNNSASNNALKGTANNAVP